MTTTRELLSCGIDLLSQAGIDSARLEARLLLMHALGIDGNAVIPTREVAVSEQSRFAELLARRRAREPFAYITGTKEFWSLEFEVGTGVLLPRPESETLIEESLRRFPDRNAPFKLLDLGTGSGCLLISFLSLYANATGVGLDMSADALSWARRNVARHGLLRRCELREESWSDCRDSGFKVVLANPPYLTMQEFADANPEISLYEPRSALAAGTDGLECYRELVAVVARSLAAEGLAFVEIGAGQAGPVSQLFSAGGLEVLHITPDLAGIPRCVVVERRG